MSSILEAIAQHARTRPDAPAVSGSKVSFTFAALAAAIDALVVNDGLRASIGTEARLWCEAHCSREAMLDAMEQVFRRALAG